MIARQPRPRDDQRWTALPASGSIEGNGTEIVVNGSKVGKGFLVGVARPLMENGKWIDPLGRWCASDQYLVIANLKVHHVAGANAQPVSNRFGITVCDLVDSLALTFSATAMLPT
jgi:hypothetical protein